MGTVLPIINSPFGERRNKMNVTKDQWKLLCQIAEDDKGFGKALYRPEFSGTINGQQWVNLYWLYAWYCSYQVSGNRRFFRVTAAIGTACPELARYDIEVFLPEAKRLRYQIYC
jgi:hypothetical protein